MVFATRYSYGDKFINGAWERTLLMRVIRPLRCSGCSKNIDVGNIIARHYRGYKCNQCVPVKGPNHYQICSVCKGSGIVEI